MERVSWTDDRIELLKALRAKGVSCSQIAKQLGGVTRNAVIGKACRLGLQVSAGRQRASQTNGRAKKLGAAERTYTAPEMRALPPLREAQALAAKPWLERAAGECCWPVDGDGASTLSCCAPVLKRGWCAAHYRIGTQAPIRARSDAERNADEGRRAKALERMSRRYAA